MRGSTATLGARDKYTLEAEVEAYLSVRVKGVHGFIRKVAWPGKRYAPDRLISLPYLRTGEPGFQHFFLELKKPGGLRTFPNNARERGQLREHNRMRKMGFRVELVDSAKGVDELLRIESDGGLG